jgi:hypothetical protein
MLSRSRQRQQDERQAWESAAGGDALAGAPASFNPQIVSATSQDFNTAATTVTVTLPARNAGDRLVLCLNRSGTSADAIATPSGWTALDASSLTGTTASFARVYYQDVTAGNVGDASAGFTGGFSVLSNSLIWRLSGCDPAVAPVANGTLQDTNATTVDPGALTGPNAGAVQRNLWLAYVGTSQQDTTLGGTPAVTGFPSGYGDTGTSTTTSGVIASGCGQGWASKVATAGSDDPSAWTYCPAGTARALAITIAVRGVITP